MTAAPCQLKVNFLSKAGSEATITDVACLPSRKKGSSRPKRVAIDDFCSLSQEMLSSRDIVVSCRVDMAVKTL